jgi:hypothetical protein
MITLASRRRVWQLVLGEPQEHAHVLAAVPSAGPPRAGAWYMSKGMSIFNRIYGVKPGRDAPPLERAYWFRRYYFVNLALAVPACVLVLVFLPAWVLVIVLLPTLVGWSWLAVEIKRERRRH